MFPADVEQPCVEEHRREDGQRRRGGPGQYRVEPRRTDVPEPARNQAELGDELPVELRSQRRPAGGRRVEPQEELVEVDDDVDGDQRDGDRRKGAGRNVVLERQHGARPPSSRADHHRRRLRPDGGARSAARRPRRPPPGGSGSAARTRRPSPSPRRTPDRSSDGRSSGGPARRIPAEVGFRARELVLGHRLAGQAIDLPAEAGLGRRHVLRRRPDVERDAAGAPPGGVGGAHGVGEPLLIPQGPEQPARHPAPRTPFATLRAT